VLHIAAEMVAYAPARLLRMWSSPAKMAGRSDPEYLARSDRSGLSPGGGGGGPGGEGGSPGDHTINTSPDHLWRPGTSPPVEIFGALIAGPSIAMFPTSNQAVISVQWTNTTRPRAWPVAQLS